MPKIDERYMTCLKGKERFSYPFEMYLQRLYP